MVTILDNKNKPIIILIGQSGAGKSKFISEFLHEKVKGFLPKRKDGQTTKFITIYNLKHSCDMTVELTVNFADKDIVRDIFKERLLSAIKSISKTENEVAATTAILEDHHVNKEFSYNMDTVICNEDEKSIFFNNLYDDKDKLLDLNLLVRSNKKIDYNQINSYIYSECKYNRIDNALDKMIENLYYDLIDMYFPIKESESVYKDQIILDKFCKKDIRPIEILEPLIKSVEYSIPCSSEYVELLFNNDNDGLIFLDTVGTDHTGEDNLETICGIYNNDNRYDSDKYIITFINDIMKFREREKAISCIFDKIISDNNLSKFMLVNTKIDRKLTKGTFEEIKDEFKDEKHINNYLFTTFREYEKEVIEGINNDLFKGLENSIKEYVKNTNMKFDLVENIIKKIKVRCEANSIYLPNPETDADNHSEIMSKTDLEILERVSSYNVKDEIKKYIGRVYENYKLINNSNLVYIKKNVKEAPLFYIKDNERFDCFVDEVILEFIKSYEKLRYEYPNSMRALSNGFARKQFTAYNSYFGKSFPNYHFLNIIRSLLRSKSFNDCIHKNYEVDFSKINRDNLIFEDRDPVVFEKLNSQLSYASFDNLVWEQIKKKLINLNQYQFTKQIDLKWDNYNHDKIKKEFENYYNQENLINVIEKFEFDNNRWSFMGNIIGYQFKCIFNLNRDFFKLKLIEFIKSSFERVNALTGKEIIVIEEHLRSNIDRKFKNILEEQTKMPDISVDEVKVKEEEHGLGEKAKVFIVHGHDEASARRVKEFIKEDLNMDAIILMDEVSANLTIPEKFEQYAKECDYAIILMTPDDKFKYDGSNDVVYRARQNVILELGYFWAKFDRKRFAVLKRGNIEKPSDIQGVVYLEFNNSVEEVFYKLQKEIGVAFKR